MNITGKELYYAIINGAMKIIEIKGYLNKINVFPVPDGDTGTNLSHTMEIVIHKSQMMPSACETLKNISRSAIEGARGNSGIIMAEYINGLYKGIGSAHNLTDIDLIHMFSMGYKSAYDAVATPVEGSILTVMKVFSKTYEQFLKEGNGFETSLDKATEVSIEALNKTTYQMKILRKNKVVDSGAKGFIAFVEGVNEYFKNGCKSFEVRQCTLSTMALESTLEHEPHNEGPTYCYELLVEPCDRILKEKICEWGDSVVIAGDQQLMKVHIHTDVPGRVLDYIADRGFILEQKIDDMRYQQRMIDMKDRKIAIVTDSIADISNTIIQSNPIGIIPMYITVDNTEYLDRFTLSTKDFFDKSDNTELFSRSSMPRQRDIERQFQFLSNYYDKVVVITVSSALSGTFNLIRKVMSENNNFGIDVLLVDSKLNSGAQGLLVKEVADLIKVTDSLEDIKSEIETIRQRISIYVSVHDFSYMVRGGRMGQFKGKLATYMNLMPIVTLDEEGHGKAFAKTFNRKQNINKIMEIVMTTHLQRGVKDYCIVHGENPSLALEVERLVYEIVGKEALYIKEISPVIAISTGRGAVAVSMITER